MKPTARALNACALIGVAMIGTGAGSCGGSERGSDDTGPVPKSRIQAESASEASRGGAAVTWDDMYTSEVFTREFDYDTDRLLVRSRELDPSSGAWFENEHAFRSSFEIKAVDTRGATEFYLLGKAANGDDVIEQWIMQDVEGSYTAIRTRAMTPFGVPSALQTSTTTVIVGGGPYLPDRPLDPEMARIELYRGSDFSPIRGLAPDVDGRFVHFAGGPAGPGVYTIGLFGLPPLEPTEVVGIDQLPELIHCDDLYVHYSALAGWSWWINLDDRLEKVLAIDSDNDGIPTAFDVVTDEQLLTEYGSWEYDRHDWW